MNLDRVIAAYGKFPELVRIGSTGLREKSHWSKRQLNCLETIDKCSLRCKDFLSVKSLSSLQHLTKYSIWIKRSKYCIYLGKISI